MERNQGHKAEVKYMDRPQRCLLSSGSEFYLYFARNIRILEGTDLRIRAIPFEILRGAEWGKICGGVRKKN